MKKCKHIWFCSLYTNDKITNLRTISFFINNYRDKKSKQLLNKLNKFSDIIFVNRFSFNVFSLQLFSQSFFLWQNRPNSDKLLKFVFQLKRIRRFPADRKKKKYLKQQESIRFIELQHYITSILMNGDMGNVSEAATSQHTKPIPFLYNV